MNEYGSLKVLNLEDFKGTQPSIERVERPSVSVLILGYNEAGNIMAVYKLVSKNLSDLGFVDFEIIFVDGGSTDETPEIMDNISSQHDCIRVFKVDRQDRRIGIGRSFELGVRNATKEYIGWFPGDNETLPETITDVLDSVGKADVIVPYTVNPWARPLGRRVLSVVYTWLVNHFFGLRLKYYNGPCYFKREVLSRISRITVGPSYMAEILIQLIKQHGASYLEVPMYIKARDYGAPSVLKWKNVYNMGRSFLSLFLTLYFGRKARFRDGANIES